jgi:hypothetical protein
LNELSTGRTANNPTPSLSIVDEELLVDDPDEFSEDCEYIPASGSMRKVGEGIMGMYIFVRPTGRKSVVLELLLNSAVGLRLTPTPILV